MKTRLQSSIAILLLVANTLRCAGQPDADPALPGQGLAAGSFKLREMDFHLHAGMERPVDLGRWLELAVADGRKVILLLDHLELYRKTPEQYEAWRAKGGFQARYPVGTDGHKALFADFDAAARRKGVLIFKGWEVSEDELDSGLELAPLRMADVIGFHISPKNGAAAPNGQTLLKRVRQIKDLQKQLPIPMILFHPFPMRMENLQRTAKEKGRDLKTLTVEEYRFFRPGEQEELVRLLKGASIYIEMNRDTEHYFEDSVCREALIADILPLAKAGVQFTVGTDNHGLAAAKKQFAPERYCEPAGVTPANCNAIVRELLAARAKRSFGRTEDNGANEDQTGKGVDTDQPKSVIEKGLCPKVKEMIVFSKTCFDTGCTDLARRGRQGAKLKPTPEVASRVGRKSGGGDGSPQCFQRGS